MENIVKIIDRVRAENSVARGRLTKGICGTATLLRAERDERGMDKLLIDTLMQRLGRSVRSFEFILSSEDYDKYVERESIRRDTRAGRYEEARKSIDRYAGKYKNSGTGRLHEQIMLLMESYILDKQQVEPALQKEFILKAIRLTIPTFSLERFPELYFGEVELTLISRLAYLHMLSGEEREANAYWESLYGLLERSIYRDCEQVQVFAVVAYHLSKYYYSQGMYGRVREICTKILGFMKDKNKLLYAAELMELLAKSIFHETYPGLAEGEITPERLRELKEYRHFEVLKGFLSDNYPEWNADTEYPMYYEYGMLCDRRIIKQRRLLLGISQEKLILPEEDGLSAEAICTVDTISRLENGHHSTQKRTVKRLLKRMGLPEERCFSDIFVEDYDVKQELDRINVLICNNREKEAYELLQTVKRKIDMNCNMSRQGVEWLELIYQRKKEKYTPQERYHRLIELLEYTLPWSRREKYKDCYLFDNENWIACLIAGCLAEMGEKEEADKLYQDVLAGIWQYLKEGEGFVHRYMAILHQRESWIANEGRLEEADRIIDYAVPLSLRHNIAGILGSWIYDKAWNLEQRGLDEEGMAQYRRYVRQSYVISCLRGQNRKDFLEKRCREHYPEENILEGLTEE